MHSSVGKSTATRRPTRHQLIVVVAVAASLLGVAIQASVGLRVPQNPLRFEQSAHHRSCVTSCRCRNPVDQTARPLRLPTQAWEPPTLPPQ